MSGARQLAPASRLRPADLLPVGTVGLRARPLRAALSALGVAVGIAAIVAVLGITRSSQAELLAQIDQLGTNLLTVVNGRSIQGGEAELPVRASAMLTRVDGVRYVAPTAQLDGVSVYRSDRIPVFQSGALAVRACDPTLLATVDGRVRHGGFLNQATAHFPVTVLGAQAARSLGIASLDAPTRVWLGDHWFTVVGLLDPFPLAPELDRSALVGFPAAHRLLGHDGHPSRIYVRTATERTGAVASLLAATADPVHPEQVRASRPSDALAARLAAKSATTGQFLVESLLLAALGGAAGVAAGAAITSGVAQQRHWAVLVPAVAAWGGLASALLVGAVAGLYPALRAARLAPTDALRSS